MPHPGQSSVLVKRSICVILCQRKKLKDKKIILRETENSTKRILNYRKNIPLLLFHHKGTASGTSEEQIVHYHCRGPMDTKYTWNIDTFENLCFTKM